MSSISFHYRRVVVRKFYHDIEVGVRPLLSSCFRSVEAKVNNGISRKQFPRNCFSARSSFSANFIQSPSLLRSLLPSRFGQFPLPTPTLFVLPPDGPAECVREVVQLGNKPFLALPVFLLICLASPQELPPCFWCRKSHRDSTNCLSSVVMSDHCFLPLC